MGTPKVTFVLRKVDATDPAVWARITAMDAACFPRGSAPALADNRGAWWIAQAGGVDAGYGGIKETSTGVGYLCRAGVLQRFRRNGLQQALIRRRVAYAKRVGWWAVITDTHYNTASSNALIACGFRLYAPVNPWSFATALYWYRPFKEKAK